MAIPFRWARAAIGAGLTISLDWFIVLISLALQLTLGLLFGHIYDMRIFMATGYLVGTGQNPYLAQDLTAVFHNPYFRGMTSIGYLPPWPLILGLIYRAVFPQVSSLLIYNLAIKIPLIAANLALAYLVAGILRKLGAKESVAHRAWVFLLLNPFLLYFGSAWGQIDAIVALFALLSLVLLDQGRVKSSAVCLALAISFKPIALPILPVAFIYLWGKSLKQAAVYTAVFMTAILLFCVAPFGGMGWDLTPILKHWNAHFTVGGGMSLLTIYELLKDTYALPGNWWLLGLAWIPFLGIAVFLTLKQGINNLVDLIITSTALVLVFYLTRTWLSEPNLILLLPLVLILTSMGVLNRVALLAVWMIPLIFTVFNTSLPQLLFLNFPALMQSMLRLADEYRETRLICMIVLVILWQMAGWWIFTICFKHIPYPIRLNEG